MESHESTTAKAFSDQADPAQTRLPRRSIGENAQKSLFASGSALGAIAMSACCIVPLVLFSLGVTGAWIGNLTALYPYKPYFFFATAGFLAAGFWKVYRKPKAGNFTDGSYCASTLPDVVNKIVLWSATMLVLAALAFPYAVPLFFEI